MVHLDMIEIHRNEIKATKQTLTENDHSDLIDRLKNEEF